jgi:hypothetical protein
MPASVILLASFIADSIGTCTGQCIRNWLNGLRLWHLYNRAEWFSHDSWITSLAKSADKEGIPIKRPPHHPVTHSHLLSLWRHLVLSSPVDAAIWFTALAAFWGCRCLGELLVRSAPSFSFQHDTTRQTTGIRGGECILTATNDLLCPIWALKNHFHINNIADHNVPLCAFCNGDSWSHLTKQKFLHVTSGMV